MAFIISGLIPIFPRNEEELTRTPRELRDDVLEFVDAFRKTVRRGEAVTVDRSDVRDPTARTSGECARWHSPFSTGMDPVGFPAIRATSIDLDTTPQACLLNHNHRSTDRPSSLRVGTIRDRPVPTRGRGGLSPPSMCFVLRTNALHRRFTYLSDGSVLCEEVLVPNRDHKVVLLQLRFRDTGKLKLGFWHINTGIK